MESGDEQARLETNGLPRPLPPLSWRDRLAALVERPRGSDGGIAGRLEDRPVLMTALAGLFAAVSVVGLVAGWNVWQARSSPPVEELLPMISPERPAGAVAADSESEPADTGLSDRVGSTGRAETAPNGIALNGTASGERALGDTALGDTAATDTAATDRASDQAGLPGAASVEIAVHIAGAVEAPGVVYLAPGSRVVDAVQAGGGALTDADLDRLNLASLVDDGQRVYVPLVGEEVTIDPLASQPSSPAATALPLPPVQIDLNTASELELQELPGIGPTMAAAIVTYRESVGAFVSVDELTNVSGIGPARLESIRPMARVTTAGQ